MFVQAIKEKERDRENKQKELKRKGILTGLEEQQKTFKDFMRKKQKIDLTPSNNLKTD